jgi:PAS domain-containing protein
VAALLLVLGAAIHFSLLARERKRALETIRKGEQRFRTMFEASPLGIALIDSISYEYRDINPRYQEILGRSQHELRACAGSKSATRTMWCRSRRRWPC